MLLSQNMLGECLNVGNLLCQSLVVFLESHHEECMLYQNWKWKTFLMFYSLFTLVVLNPGCLSIQLSSQPVNWAG